MATTLARIIRYGLQSLRRNPWLSIATVLVMLFALVLSEGLILFNVVTETAITALEDKIDIAVYFKTTATEDAILELEQSLEALAEVERVEYVSRDRALELFREANRDDPTITRALEELEGNPLRASLNIKARNPEDYAAIDAYLGNERLGAIVEKVSFTQSRLAIERLARIVATAERFGFLLTLFLAFTAALVTFNTIRLAIYSNREEIGIMRLVGASNSFINGPYLVGGLLLGIIAAVFSLLIALPLVQFGAPHLKNFIPEMDLAAYFSANFLALLGYQLLFGIALGVLSSAIAVRRYLKI